jgi:DNA-binding NarL/FixJ family response regulator
VLAPIGRRTPIAQDARVAWTVLIVDDHADFRASARALLEADGYDVVAEADDAASVVRMVEQHAPSVVLLDIGLPDVDGFTVAAQLATLAHPPAVVLISSRERTAYGRRVDMAPVRGFLPKRQLSGRALDALLT